MARSVDYLSGATAVAYLSGHDIEDAFQWELLKDSIKSMLTGMFPSLEDADGWDGHETHIFLENGHCEIGISEYCGLVSISMRPKDDYYGNEQPLAQSWCERVAEKFTTIGELRKIGTFSNGEAVFETISKPTHTYTSKEGLCDWLEPEAA